MAFIIAIFDMIRAEVRATVPTPGLAPVPANAGIALARRWDLLSEEASDNRWRGTIER